MVNFGFSQQMPLPCHENINCHPEWKNIKNSVFLYSFNSDEGSSCGCTGALINSSALNGRLLFLTAGHCVNSQSEIENLTFFINREEECDLSVINEIMFKAKGTLLYTGTGTMLGLPKDDITLIELSQFPDNAPLLFAGWDRTGLTPIIGTTIHHPQGGKKKISISNSVKSYSLFKITVGALNDCVESHYLPPNSSWDIKWKMGLTEAISSGAPFFDAKQRYIGTLSSGLSYNCNLDESNSTFQKLISYWNGIGDYLDPKEAGIRSGVLKIDSYDPRSPELSAKISYEDNNDLHSAESVFQTLDEEPFQGFLRSFIYPVGDADHFEFDLSNPGALTLTLKNITGNYDLFLYDQTGQLLSQSISPGSGEETVTFEHSCLSNTSKTVIAKIVGTNGSNSTTPYKLEVNWQPVDLNLSINGQGAFPNLCINNDNNSIILNATASGGTPPYTCSWDNCQKQVSFNPFNAALGIISGSNGVKYPVQITDANGCKAEGAATVIFIPVLCSRDPNDIIGPTGYGESRWVSINDKLPYKIRFENDPDFATAPAQRVAIEHHPDEDLNLFSVRLGDFGFANQFFSVPDNSTFYSKRLDLRDSLGIFVDVTAGIDVTDNKVFWIFQSIDPATGLPPGDPTVGLLPVNDTLLQNGEGFVDFTVRPKSAAVTGDSVLAKASIVFDDNETIFTPEIFNIIDALPPASAIIPNLPATSATPAFHICWNGHDDPGGCGIRDYALYYSTNDGPFLSYQSGIEDTCVSFTGLPGNTYSFYTLATDNVGNTEPDKTAGDIQVSISDENKLVLFALSDDALCAGDSLTLQWEASGVGRVKVLLSSGGNYTLLQDNLPATPGLFTWHIPTGFAGCNDCRLIVADTVAGSPLSDTSFVIQIHPAITADAGPDISVCAGKSISLQATGGDQYAWSPDTGLDDPSVANPTLTATQMLTYIVQVRNAARCSDTDSINIQVLPADITSLVSMTCDASEAGVHYDTLTNRFGCDSVVITGVILDTIPPQAACKALTLALDETGQATLSPESADNGSTDNCGIATLSLSRTLFTCADLGQNPVLLTLTDVNGNSATCVSTVTVADNNLPPACGGGGPAFLFHYPGPDTLGVGAGCTGILDWGPNGPVVHSATGNTVTVFALDSVLTGYAFGDTVPVNTTVLVAYIAQDDELHRDTFFFPITFTDLTQPVLTCPVSLSVACGSNLNPQQNLAPGKATAMDACDPAPVVSYTDQSTTGQCPVLAVVERTWSTIDQAGNSAQCVQVITVEDLTPPVIGCPAPVTVSPNLTACAYTVPGLAFDPVAVFDSCNVSTTGYILSGATTNAGASTIEGAMLNSGITVVTWTASDNCGRTGTCSFSIQVLGCSDISGRLIWEGDDSTGVDSASIRFSGNFSTVIPTIPGGFFAWHPVAGDSFVLVPAKPSPPARWDNGVNAGDALAIQRHVAGIMPITDPYKLIAADVDLNNLITGNDAVVIRRALLKSPSAIAVMRDSTWRFVPTPPVYVPGPNPFAAPIPEQRSVISTGGMGSGQDFYGIKKGDVNGTAKPYLLHPLTASPLVLLVQDHALQAGQELTAVFRVSHFDRLGAYQMAFQFDPLQIQLIAVNPAQTDIHLQVTDHFGLYNTTSGEILSVWEAPYGVSLSEGTAIFSFRFKALQSGALLSEVLRLNPKSLPPEAVTVDEVSALIQLVFIEAQSTGTLNPAVTTGVQLLQNRPNPFTDQTIIGFILPAACDAQLRVVDVDGREVMRLDKTYAVGYHEESIRLGEVASPGMLYYELTTPFGKLVRKMLVVDN